MFICTFDPFRLGLSKYTFRERCDEEPEYTLNDGTVSKAITAQYLAGMITGQLPPIKGNEELKEKVKGILENDERLEYIKKAIEHVTA